MAKKNYKKKKNYFKKRKVNPQRDLYKLHHFKRKCAYSSLVVGSGGTGYSSAGYVFALNDLPNYTEFSSLYDRFCIRYVKLHIVCRAVNLSLIESYNNNSLGFPEIIYCIDHDDNTPPSADAAGMNELRQYNDSRGFLFTSNRRDCEISLKPSVLANTYEGVAATAYRSKFDQYVSTTDYATPHYGVKLVVRVPFSGGTMPGNVYFDVYATYWLRMKDPK